MNIPIHEIIKHSGLSEREVLDIVEKHKTSESEIIDDIAELSRKKHPCKSIDKKWGDVHFLLSSPTNVVGLDLDRPIRQLVLDLNEAGFVTAGSCAGHGLGRYGYVTFERTNFSPSEEEEILDIFMDNGINDAKFRNRNPREHFSTVAFSSVLD